MMKRQPRPQPKLFYSCFNLDERIRKDHFLRKVADRIDFDFIYDDVKDLYGTNGNPSIPPPVLLKLMLLLVAYNVRSERELMETLPERLDWLWFLGFDVDSPIPNHSVLSKARTRWGVTVFRRLFERVVGQCVEAGLVDGRKLFVDASVVDADAAMKSIVDVGSLRHRLHASYPEFERRLTQAHPAAASGYQKVNNERVSTTDPDATLLRAGAVKLAYKVHRGVDGASEVITATRTTGGDIHESHVLEAWMDDHEAVTETQIQTVVADAQYGTIDNLLRCHDRHVQTHMPHLSRAAQKRNQLRGVFPEDRFPYDPQRDVLVCPTGHELKPYGPDRKNRYRLYAATTAVCAVCALRPQCTDNKRGRRVMRRIRQAELDQKRAEAGSAAAKRDGRTRHHLMERSFARAKRYCYDRARWRGRWRMEIQELLVCITQNLHVLVRKGRPRLAEASAQALRAARDLSDLLVHVAAWLPRLRHDTDRLFLSPRNRAPA